MQIWKTLQDMTLEGNFPLEDRIKGAVVQRPWGRQ